MSDTVDIQKLTPDQRSVEWDDEDDDGHALVLSIGCMTFNVDLDCGVLTMETDVDINRGGAAATDVRLRDFCADVVRLFEKHKML